MTDNTAPERIWLQTGGDYATYHNVSAEDEEQITWCWHKVEDDDQEYVRVDLYEAALADLQAENKELRDALHEIASTICDCHHRLHDVLAGRPLPAAGIPPAVTN